MIKYFAALAALLSSVQAQYTISRVAGSRLELGMSPTAVYVVYPTRLTYDSAGRFYFMAENRIFRVSGGVVDLVIGGGTYGLGGEGGLATAATVQLRFPSGLAVDRFNNLYILDYTVVRKVDATTGIITTVAGPGPPAGFFLGDGGPATSASFASSDIAVDFEGNLYIADSQHARVRKVAVGTGIISTVAGNGNSTESGDGGPATSAGVVGSRLALDTAGNLYLGGKYRVRKVTASTGIITTIAGTGTDGLTGDGGPAILATLGYPFSIGTDSSGNIYVSCHDGTIRKVTAAGIISTIAGTGGLATQATVDPEGRMAVDAAGNILYSQSNDSLILRIDGSTNIITTVAGTTDALGDNGPASLAQFAEASGIASDAAGNIYIADAGARRVRKISATTGTITTIAGNGKIGSDGDGGLATNAAIVSSSRSVLQIAVDPVNDLYLADDSGNIRRVSSQTGIISTVVTNPNLANPGDLIVDSSGIYVTIQNLVRVDPVSGSLKELSLTTSSGIDRDAFGNFYLTNRSTIHKVSGGSETTVAGNCVAQTCPDSVFFTGAQLGDGGLAVDATLNRPYGVKVDHSGNLLIADIYDMRVRLVSASTGKISTIAGTNVPGCSGQGPATSARLIAPFRFGLDGTGNIYVLDAGCKQLFKLSPPSPSYAGNLDIVNCQTISGWAADRSRLGQSITVSIYDGSTLLGTVTANQLRSDVGSLLGDSGLHGFSLPLPASVRDGTPLADRSRSRAAAQGPTEQESRQAQPDRARQTVRRRGKHRHPRRGVRGQPGHGPVPAD